MVDKNTAKDMPGTTNRQYPGVKDIDMRGFVLELREFVTEAGLELREEKKGVAGKIEEDITDFLTKHGRSEAALYFVDELRNGLQGLYRSYLEKKQKCLDDLMTRLAGLEAKYLKPDDHTGPAVQG
jgi:hypothetical protein